MTRYKIIVKIEDQEDADSANEAENMAKDYLLSIGCDLDKLNLYLKGRVKVEVIVL